jgi:alcohol dehydrogenase class IV
MIDEAVREFSGYKPSVVVAIGGGSVLDAGKAISAMLPLQDSVKNYLEGVGSKSHPGDKIPFVAVPTTSGTGSEATKNAVLSEIGDRGYKRSLRHNRFVPDVAIVDPALTVSCPPAATAASGMDAFTQLLESYVSTAANPITDALAYEGLKCISGALLKTYHDGSDLEARAEMSLASYLSGVTLANAGLGLVHGFASPIGGYFDIPHGVICSALMSPANEVTIRKLRAGNTKAAEALHKYAAAGKLFSGLGDKTDTYYVDHLLSIIENYTQQLEIPNLASFGVKTADIDRIVKASDNKNNPVALDREEMIEVLEIAIGHWI